MSRGCVRSGAVIYLIHVGNRGPEAGRAQRLELITNDWGSSIREAAGKQDIHFLRNSLPQPTVTTWPHHLDWGFCLYFVRSPQLLDSRWIMCNTEPPDVQLLRSITFCLFLWKSTEIWITLIFCLILTSYIHFGETNSKLPKHLLGDKTGRETMITEFSQNSNRNASEFSEFMGNKWLKYELGSI